MKHIIFAIALLVPLVGHAADTNMLAGRYAGCAVGLDSTGDAPTSRFYVLTFGTDASLSLTVESYAGSDKCENNPVSHDEYRNFEVIDDSGNHPGRIIKAQEMRSKLFFKFVIAKSYAAIDSSKSYPVAPEFVDSMVLDKVP